MYDCHGQYPVPSFPSAHLSHLSHLSHSSHPLLQLNLFTREPIILPLSRYSLLYHILQTPNIESS